MFKFFRKVFLTSALITFPIWEVYAHGGGESPPPKKERLEEPRATANKPDILEDSELRKLSELKRIPEDVLFIRCTLSEYAVCRGLDISLYDLSGKRLLTGNTGTEGLVGFEGLKTNTKYIAKIDNPKYQGEMDARAGAFHVMNGDRKD
ncbi:MAG: hypothetical protein AB7G93_13265 [Bdellovibrionales bacterium]